MDYEIVSATFDEIVTDGEGNVMPFTTNFDNAAGQNYRLLAFAGCNFCSLFGRVGMWNGIFRCHNLNKLKVIGNVTRTNCVSVVACFPTSATLRASFHQRFMCLIIFVFGKQDNRFSTARSWCARTKFHTWSVFVVFNWIGEMTTNESEENWQLDNIQKPRFKIHYSTIYFQFELSEIHHNNVEITTARLRVFDRCNCIEVMWWSSKLSWWVSNHSNRPLLWWLLVFKRDLRQFVCGAPRRCLTPSGDEFHPLCGYN